MMRKAIVLFAAAAALTSGVFAASKDAQKTVPTVGDFAVTVSKALGHTPADQDAAVAVLKNAGVDLGKDLSAKLTEGQAARILQDLGVAVKTANPQAYLSADKAGQLVANAGLVSPIAASIAATDLPAQCLSVKNRGNCQTCCNSYFGCDLSAPTCDYASTCAKFCKQVLPPGKASPSEPQP
jgi:hypothetical protein